MLKHATSTPEEREREEDQRKSMETFEEVGEIDEKSRLENITKEKQRLETEIESAKIALEKEKILIEEERKKLEEERQKIQNSKVETPKEIETKSEPKSSEKKKKKNNSEKEKNDELEAERIALEKYKALKASQKKAEKLAEQ